MTSIKRSLSHCSACTLVLALTLPACAHHQALGGSKAGIAIPSISHGQMVVLDSNRAAILAAADRQNALDGVARRLATYVDLQRFTCAWGLVPGHLEDESSPFNECTHAYLAGTQALLKRLQSAHGSEAGVRDLQKTIDLEMLDNQTSSVPCQFSGEPFNTADVVYPRWHDVPVDPLSSLLILVGLIAAAAALRAAGRMMGRRAASHPPQSAR